MSGFIYGQALRTTNRREAPLHRTFSSYVRKSRSRKIGRNITKWWIWSIMIPETTLNMLKIWICRRNFQENYGIAKVSLLSTLVQFTMRRRTQEYIMTYIVRCFHDIEYVCPWNASNLNTIHCHRDSEGNTTIHIIIIVPHTDRCDNMQVNWIFLQIENKWFNGRDNICPFMINTVETIVKHSRSGNIFF